MVDISDFLRYNTSTLKNKDKDIKGSYCTIRSGILVVLYVQVQKLMMMMMIAQITIE